MSGTLAVGFELSALFLHHEDYERGNIANAVWVTLPASESAKPPTSVKGEFVNVIGTFTAKEHGHLGAFIGTIDAEALIPYTQTPPN